MAKTKLKFDAAQLKDFCCIYKEVPQDDGYGGTNGMTWDLVASPRCKKNIKNKTSQIQVQGGGWDFYQVYEFTIRDNPNYEIEIDMIVYSDNKLYVIRGFAPSESNPMYVTLYTETINDSLHALWDIINSNPIEADYETIYKQ
jgi:hypothetical protein